MEMRDKFTEVREMDLQVASKLMFHERCIWMLNLMQYTISECHFFTLSIFSEINIGFVIVMN